MKKDTINKQVEQKPLNNPPSEKKEEKEYTLSYFNKQLKALLKVRGNKKA